MRARLTHPPGSPQRNEELWRASGADHEADTLDALIAACDALADWPPANAKGRFGPSAKRP
jgi:hypothetical protein